MQIDEFLELVRKRRSIRKFKPTPVPEEYVEKILLAARWAMSGGNAQPWEFIVVRNPRTKNNIAAAIFEQRKIEFEIEQTRIKDLRHPGVLNPPSIPDFREAPVLIVVCGDRRTLMATVLSHNFIGGEGAAGAVYLKNMANATQNMQLAAAALGLGSGWVSVGRIAEGSIKAILGVPDSLEIHTIVPVGYVKYTPPPAYRRELQEIVHFEKYDNGKFRSMDDIIKFLQQLRKRSRIGYRKN
jgi:nitroreductase